MTQLDRDDFINQIVNDNDFRDNIPNNFTFYVHFKSNIMGTFKQSIIFDFSQLPYLEIELVVDVGLHDLSDKLHKDFKEVKLKALSDNTWNERNIKVSFFLKDHLIFPLLDFYNHSVKINTKTDGKRGIRLSSFSKIVSINGLLFCSWTRLAHYLTCYLFFSYFWRFIFSFRRKLFMHICPQRLDGNRVIRDVSIQIYFHWQDLL